MMSALVRKEGQIQDTKGYLLVVDERIKTQKQQSYVCSARVPAIAVVHRNETKKEVKAERRKEIMIFYFRQHNDAWGIHLE
jgi:hypothetical protein